MESLTSEIKPCVFCEVIEGKTPSHLVAENELSICILDINPFAEGHCLVIPRRHVPWWHDMTEPETASLFSLARSVANRLMDIYKPDFIFQYARGRRIPHTHIFLVPTFPGDPLDRYFAALEGFQEAPRRLVALGRASSLSDVAAKLRGAKGSAPG